MLTIDIGNSRIKWVSFQQGEPVNHHALEYSADTFDSVISRLGLPVNGGRVMVSLVAGTSFKSRLVTLLNKNKRYNISFAKTRVKQCGVTNSYESPEHMGVDRWLAMIAAFQSPLKAAGEAVCVIDCGTAITLDIVDGQGLHLGGLIMPGLKTMREALVAKASRLHIDDEAGADISGILSLASSTENAITQGCAQLVLEGISGIVERHKRNIKSSLRCIITGGDGEWVSRGLGQENDYEPLLVHYGLRLVANESR
ncbi:Pantothenate kinase type III, CoaX-like [hydrothermal vent metagenome]|uniref:Type III pantothenate kinase n=1 Tax=hydrothermal vent metagenome TaxID=652676 RepID=A0A3B0XYH2_9ZZZZ